MAITKIKASKYQIKLKATIQKTGKLGFSDVTAKELGLSNEGGVFLGEDENGTLYMKYVEQWEEDSFKVLKSKDYFSLNTTQFFEEKKFDFKKNTIIFDLSWSEEEEGWLIMKPRKIEKKKKEVSASEE